MSATWILVLVLGAICFQNALAHSKENVMQLKHKWKFIDYKYNSAKEKEAAIKSGKYNYTKCFPIDVDRWHDKTFVTIIRDEGVPSSLNVISDETGEGGPLLAPYPDWSWTDPKNCDNIISVYRVAIDKCDRLWVLDTGVNGDTHVCPAKLLVFHLPSSKLLKRIIIPDKMARNSTSGEGLLVTPIVHTSGEHCEKIDVYIADAEGYGLIHYNGKTFHRYTSPSFVFDPRATVYTINKESFSLNDGILGMALSPLTGRLYYSAMSSFHLRSIDTASITSLKDRTLEYKTYNFVPTQYSAKAASTSGTVFFGMVSNTAIGCYNELRPHRKERFDIVAANDETLQFTSGMKVKHHRNVEELLIMTNRYQKIATGSMNFKEVNFRILSQKVKNLIRNTRCQPTFI